MYAQFVKRSSPKILQLFVIWSLGFHFSLRRVQSRAHKRYHWWEHFLFARRAVQKKGNYCLRNSADVLISTSQTFWYFNNDYLGYNRAEEKKSFLFCIVKLGLKRAMFEFTFESFKHDNNILFTQTCMHFGTCNKTKWNL